VEENSLIFFELCKIRNLRFELTTYGMNMFGNFNTQFMASFVGHLKSSTLVEGQISYTIYDDYKSQITYK